MWIYFILYYIYYHFKDTFCYTQIVMPIIIKDYTWDQSISSIFITIPLKGVTIRKVDLFSSPSYFKVRKVKMYLLYYNNNN